MSEVVRHQIVKAFFYLLFFCGIPMTIVYLLYACHAWQNRRNERMIRQEEQRVREEETREKMEVERMIRSGLEPTFVLQEDGTRRL